MGRGMRAGKKSKSGGSAKQKQSQQAQMVQIQAMQRQMEEKQAEIESMEETASAGGGAVSVTVSGAHRITGITIDPEACDPEDVEMLQDIIMAAANEAFRKMDEVASAEMNKMTGGLGLPAGII